MVRQHLVRLLGLAAWAGAIAPAARAQTPMSPAAARPDRPGALLATREMLQQRLAALEAAGRERPLSQPAAAELAAVRQRLLEGDFRVGDRVALFVEGEPELSDTFAVAPSGELILPVVGTVPLRGVLRSELQATLSREVARLVREPNVRATALIMLSVTGDVARPGFYPMPVSAMVADVIMAAGGGTRDAKVKDLRVERSGETLWNSAAVAGAVRDGRTLDDLGIRSGDQFVMPGRRPAGTESNLRVLTMLLGIPLTVYALTRVF